MSNPESLQVAWRIDSWMVVAPEAKKHRELQYELEDGLDNGTLSHQDAITRLTEALTASPDWLEGLLLRAALHSELDEHADSARDYKRAYIRCMAMLPKNFKGPLPWSILDNRTFLRTVAAWGLELVGQQRYDDAIRCSGSSSSGTRTTTRGSATSLDRRCCGPAAAGRA